MGKNRAARFRFLPPNRRAVRPAAFAEARQFVPVRTASRKTEADAAHGNGQGVVD